MPVDAQSKSPRKKRHAFWWLVGILLFILILFVFQLFGPNPPIVVSKQTTYITEPLGPNGLPDYEKYLLEQCRKGVTPQNNAAAILWPALWPGELDPPQYATVATELGLDHAPSTKDAVTKLYGGATQEEITKWLQKQQAETKSEKISPDAIGEDPNTDQIQRDTYPDLAETVIDRALGCPWTSQQIPPLAKWVNENQKPLDKMVEASARSRCYFPSPSLLDSEQGVLMEMLAPGTLVVRNAGRMLSVRAMLLAGENHHKEAWRDLLAIHRVGHLFAQDSTALVEKCAGLAVDGIARDNTLALLAQRSLTAAQARQIQHDLELIPNFHTVAASLNNFERLSYLDTVIAYHNDPKNKIGDIEGLPHIKYLRVDFNAALWKGNEYFDRIVAAMHLPQCTARNQATTQIESDLSRLGAKTEQSVKSIAGAIDPNRRSDIVASAMICSFMPAFKSAMDAEDRANAELELERLAAALAIFRIEHGKYPEKLEELVPGQLKKLPVDLYNAIPFIYKRTEDGYLLYSAGENGKDDGGSTEIQQMYEGRRQDELDEATKDKLLQKIPTGADDNAIRFPRPVFSIPKARQQSMPDDTR